MAHPRPSHRVAHKRLPKYTILASAAVLLGTWSDVAHAYIDPTAGGTLLQFLLGGFVAGMLMIIRLSWESITSPFRRGKRTHRHDEDAAHQSALTGTPSVEPGHPPRQDPA